MRDPRRSQLPSAYFGRRSSDTQRSDLRCSDRFAGRCYIARKSPHLSLSPLHVLALNHLALVILARCLPGESTRETKDGRVRRRRQRCRFDRVTLMHVS